MNPARSPTLLALRWVNVVLRGAHLVAVVSLGASLLGASLPLQGLPWAVLTSGLALFALDLWVKPHRLIEWSGAATLLKLLAVGVMAISGEWRLPLFWAILVWSAVFAHAPASFRHARWHR